MDAMRHAPPRLQMTVPVPMKTGKVAMSPGEDGLIGIPFPEHSNELLSQLNDQRRSGHLCDLTLTSRGARYHTHRSVMAAVSLYFRRLFGTEEAGGEGGGGFSVCQLDCVAPDALDALLEFAYTATLTVPSSGMRDVLQGAQLLGIQCVADACREILGEEAGDVAEETRVQYTPPKKVTVEEVDVERVSRRKNDRKKVRRIGLNWINHSLVNPSPASPVSQPSIASDSLRSPPSTQSLSPDQELRLKSEWQNGDPESVKEPGRGAAPNGGHVHWIHDRPRIAHPPPVAAANHKPSQNDDTERFGEDGTFMGSTSVPTSASERVAVTATVGEGRKRKSQTPQQCPVCQKIIHGAGKLPRHMRTHTGEKPFQCSACGVRFTRNDKLKIHMRKHTGERPYPCPHCPARFLHSYDLKNHLSLHSGARPFECPLCHKAFAREDHLQRHRKGHSCLELRTRRSRRGPELMDNGREDGGRREPSDPLEVVTSQAHTSAFHPHMILDAASGHGVGPPLMFPGDMDRGRSLALQALSSQLGPHRLAGYSELFLRGLGLRGSREVQVEDPGGTHSPGRLREHWADEVEEKVGDEDVEEEE